jgi:DNA-binding MarR family transcriptional regulator
MRVRDATRVLVIQLTAKAACYTDGVVVANMSDGVSPLETHDVEPWLDPAQLSAWLSLVRMFVLLPAAIDSQLQRDSRLGMIDYQVMAMLSESPARTLRMSDLAAQTNASLSRLSHLVTRLENRGFIRRAPDPADGRFTNAILTDAGFSALAAAAPAHVAFVRSVVIDAVSPERLRRLGQDADRIVARIQALTP